MGGRAMTLADLNGQNLTLGSTGVASILPVTWLSYQAEELPYGNLVSWSTAQEEGNQEFVILKSIDAINFEDIGQVSGKGYSNEAQSYQFLDHGINLSRKIYYQINQLDFDGNQNLSPIFQLILKNAKEVLIYPNPYENQQQPVVISIPDPLRKQPARIRVKNASGALLMEEFGVMETATLNAATHLKDIPSDAYIILVEANGIWKVIKWIKKN